MPIRTYVYLPKGRFSSTYRSCSYRPSCPTLPQWWCFQGTYGNYVTFSSGNLQLRYLTVTYLMVCYYRNLLTLTAAGHRTPNQANASAWTTNLSYRELGIVCLYSSSHSMHGGIHMSFLSDPELENLQHVSQGTLVATPQMVNTGCLLTKKPSS